MQVCDVLFAVTRSKIASYPVFIITTFFVGIGPSSSNSASYFVVEGQHFHFVLLSLLPSNGWHLQSTKKPRCFFTNVVLRAITGAHGVVLLSTV